MSTNLERLRKKEMGVIWIKGFLGKLGRQELK
jgi:hypothetical protein